MRSIALLTAVGLVPLAAAQDVLTIDLGETFAGSNLTQEMYNGIPFTLDEDLLIEVFGEIAKIGIPSTPGDFRGATVAIQPGGRAFDDYSNIRNVVIELGDGGLIGEMLWLHGGVTFKMTGGQLGRGLFGFGDNTFSLSGGVVGQGFAPNTGAVTLTGGEFRVDGVEVDAYTGGGIFSGTLADGSVFIYTGLASDQLSVSNTTLDRVALTPAETTPIILESGVAKKGLRAGQTLTLREGGALGDYFAAVSASLNIEGGTVGTGLEVLDTQVYVTGGEISDRFRAYSGSSVSVEGGLISQLIAHDGASLHVSGGELDKVHIRSGSQSSVRGGLLRDVLVQEGSELNISGGVFQSEYPTHDALEVEAGALARISGGTFDGLLSQGSLELSGGRFSDVRASGQTLLVGNEFRLNGDRVFSQSDLDGIEPDQLLTGTLSDGSVFIFDGGVNYSDLTLDFVDLGEPDRTPFVVSSGTGPRGLRPGQNMTVTGDARIGDHFAATHSDLRIEGGSFGDGLKTAYSGLAIVGGTVGDQVDLYSGTNAVIAGGDVGSTTVFDGASLFVAGGAISRVQVEQEGVLNISDGSAGHVESSGVTSIAGGTLDWLEINPYSHASITGGNISSINVFAGTSSINISGGVFGNIYGSTTVALFGDSFKLNGVDVTGAFIPGSNDVVQGILSDGSVLLLSWGDPDPNVHLWPPQFELFQTAMEEPEYAGTVLTEGLLSKGLRPGQTLTVTGEGRLGDNYAVSSASLTVEGGAVGKGLKVADGSVRISGGIVGSVVGFAGTDILIEGGTVGGVRVTGSDSVVRVLSGEVDALSLRGLASGSIEGGTFDNAVVSGLATLEVSGGNLTNVYGWGDGMLSVSGGTIERLIVEDDAVFSMSGGLVTDLFQIGSFVTFDLFVREAMLDGERLNLEQGSPFVLDFSDHWGSSISATLADGSLIQFRFGNQGDDGENYCESFHTSIHLVPAPPALGLLLVCFATGPRRRW